MTDFTKRAFEEMFRVVGLKFTPEKIKKPHWYLKKTWDIDQQHEFRDWYIIEASKEYRVSKSIADNMWRHFNLNWGWKLK